MRRLWITGILALAGAAAGVWIASDNLRLAGIMGALIGLTAAVIVFAFPRDKDYPPSHDGLLGN